MNLRYRVIPDLALCRWPTAAPLPAWLMQALTDPTSGFLQVLRSPGELTIVCFDGILPSDATPPDFRIHPGYSAMQLEGPFPLDAVGILHAFLAPLAYANVPIFALSSYLTDFVLIEKTHLDTAHSVLLRAGHQHIA